MAGVREGVAFGAGVGTGGGVVNGGGVREVAVVMIVLGVSVLFVMV